MLLVRHEAPRRARNAAATWQPRQRAPAHIRAHQRAHEHLHRRRWERRRPHNRRRKAAADAICGGLVGRQRAERPTTSPAVVGATVEVPVREGGGRKCRSAAAFGGTVDSREVRARCGLSLAAAAWGHWRRRRRACAPFLCRGDSRSTCGHSTPSTSCAGTGAATASAHTEVSIRARDGVSGRLEATHGRAGE